MKHERSTAIPPQRASDMTPAYSKPERQSDPQVRGNRVASKQELKDRLMAAVDYFNNDPVVRTWTYKLGRMI